MVIIESRVGEGTLVCHRSEFLARPLLWSIAWSDETQVSELIESRRLMEGELAALAAERRAPEDLDEIESQLEPMTSTLEQPDLFLEADLDFHLAIAEAAHNRILLNAVQLIRNLTRQWIRQTVDRHACAHPPPLRKGRPSGSV